MFPFPEVIKALEGVKFVEVRVALGCAAPDAAGCVRIVPLDGAGRKWRRVHLGHGCKRTFRTRRARGRGDPPAVGRFPVSFADLRRVEALNGAGIVRIVAGRERGLVLWMR